MTPLVKRCIKFSIIGLVVLAIAGAFIIPAFNRTRKTTWATVMISDGRIIGNSAQQYFLTTGQKSVTFTYDSTTGKITGPLEPWVKDIRKGFTFPDATIESGNSAAFSMSHPGVLKGQSVSFSDEGKTTLDPND